MNGERLGGAMRPSRRVLRTLLRMTLFVVLSFAALTRKALRPGDIESTENPRARSARLRCIERVSQ